MSFLQALNEDLSAVADHALDSLVQVSHTRGGNGAGVVWRSDGLVITNAHVATPIPGRHLGAVGQLMVTLRGGQRLEAKLIAHDPQRDLAALQVTADDLTPIELGDSLQLLPGDFVLALGFPWGIHGGATSGIVIGTGARLPEMDGREWLAASLHLRPGHSGGPLVDSRGRLVGINTLMSGPEVGVAIPVHVVQEFLTGVLDRRALPSTPAISHV